MSKISTKPPSGMRDFLPADVIARKHVIEIIEGVYRQHGFAPLETPSIENLSTLLGKYGDEGDQLLYRLLHRREKLARATEGARDEGRAVLESELADQGLRYDLTVPLARVVAQYGDLPKFFKRYQIQPVWRADRPGRGRFREFYQCDVDITGTTSQMADAEVCSAVCSAMRALGFDDFVVKLNHRELLRALIRAAGIDASLEATALVAVDKLDKIGEAGVAKELGERGIGADAAAKLLASIRLPEGEVDNAARLDALAAVVDDAGVAAVESLRELLSFTAVSPAGSHMVVDPTLARGLSYYTGPIFEAAVSDLAGSMGGGGRYDGLVGMFGKSAVPAVGFALGLERILVVMQERDMFPSLRVGPELLLCWLDVPQVEVLGMATQMRAQGLRVEVYPEAAKLKKQLHYANAAGVEAPFVAIVGKDELAAGEVTVKRLADGTQTRLPVGQLASFVRAD